MWKNIKTTPPPNSNTVVMFYDPNETLPIMARGDDYWYGRKDGRGLASWLDSATHWMNIPEPPFTGKYELSLPEPL